MSVTHWLTNSAASDSDVELMYFRNLLPPIVLPFGSSLLTVCTQYVHTSGDDFLWRLPVIALCWNENETREWEGVEWIGLEGEGCINGGMSATFCLFCLWLLDCAYFSLFTLFISVAIFCLSFFFLSWNFILEFFCSFVFIPLFLSLSPSSSSFFQSSVLSDYSGDGPVKASPIIVFEQHCSLS